MTLNKFCSVVIGMCEKLNDIYDDKQNKKFNGKFSFKVKKSLKNTVEEYIKVFENF